MLMIGMMLPIAKAINEMINMYNSIMDSNLDSFNLFWKKRTTGLKMKNRNPEINIGKNKVEKKVEIGSNKNVSFVEIKIIVRTIRICKDQFLNFLDIKNTSF